MTTDTTAGTDPSTATADDGAAPATTILDTGADDAGKTADEAGKTAADAADGKATGAEGKDDKAEGDKPKDEPPAGPPEKYEFTMPEGVELDAALVEKADPILRELNLTNEQANKLATFLAEQRVSEGQAQRDAYAKQTEDWAKAARDDAEIGGKRFDESVKAAHRFIGEYGSPELKTLLRDSGLGNHPELVRLCAKAGKAMAEDGGMSGKTATPKSTADVLFDHPTSKAR